MLFTVNQSHCRIIERFGKFNRVVYEGLHLRLPFIEEFRHVSQWLDVANEHGGLDIELSEQLTVAEARECQTKDNVGVTALASVYWKVVDPRRAVYEVDRLPNAVQDVALNALRANIGELELDMILAERTRLNEKIAAQLSDTGKKWGIQFTRTEIREIQTTSETAAAMRQQMEAERRRRASVAVALGEAEAQVRMAEADKQADILRAQGRAEAMRLVTQAESDYLKELAAKVGTDAAARILVAQKVLEGYERVSRNPAHKVFLPNQFTGVLALPADGTHMGTDDPDSPDTPLLPPSLRRR